MNPKSTELNGEVSKFIIMLEVLIVEKSQQLIELDKNNQ
jgi:hypothetical protein